MIDESRRKGDSEATIYAPALSRPQTGILEHAGFHRDLYFCLDIALRRLKDLYSWKLPSPFFSPGPFRPCSSSFLCDEKNSHSLGMYSMPGIVVCLSHSFSSLLLTTPHRYDGHPHFTVEETGINKTSNSQSKSRNSWCSWT